MFVSFHFFPFGDEVTKIWEYYEIFVYILQGKMGKTEIEHKENYRTKLTKKPKTKLPKYLTSRAQSL